MRRMNHVRLGVCAIGVMSLGLASTSLAGGFADGKLFLVSNSIPDPVTPGLSTHGILRIDPIDGGVEFLATIPFVLDHRAATFDPFRDRIILRLASFDTDLRQVDALGTVTLLPTTFDAAVHDVAPTGDGRIFMLGLSKIGWLDVQGVTHELMDDSGVAVFDPQLAQECLCIYHAPTNSLVIADRAVLDTRVQFVPLSADGTKVDGAAVQIGVVGSTATGESVVGLSSLPDGDLLLTIDDNSNSAQPRLQRIDAVAHTSVTFAVPEYFGVAGEVAGCFSALRDQAVVLDSLSDHLRAFTEGIGGEGFIFADNVSSAGGSGEVARLIEIGGTIGGVGGGPPNPADLDGDGDVDGGDLGLLLGSWGPCPGCPADLNGDGMVDGSDLGLLLGAWGA